MEAMLTPEPSRPKGQRLMARIGIVHEGVAFTPTTPIIISLFLYPSSCYTHVPEIPSLVSLPHLETSKEFSAPEEKSPRMEKSGPMIARPRLRREGSTQWT